MWWIGMCIGLILIVWPLNLGVRSAINRYWAYRQCQNLPSEQLWTALLKNWAKNRRKTAKFCHFRTPTPNSRLLYSPRRATMLGMVLKDVWGNFVHISKISDKSVGYFSNYKRFPGKGVELTPPPVVIFKNFLGHAFQTVRKLFSAFEIFSRYSSHTS